MRACAGEGLGVRKSVIVSPRALRAATKISCAHERDYLVKAELVILLPANYAVNFAEEFALELILVEG